MEFKYLLVLVCCASYGRLSDVSLDNEWEDFKQSHNKSYSNEEENRRKLIWLENINKITEHNMEADNGTRSYRLGMNEFGDMTSDEMAAKLNGVRGHRVANGSTFLPPNNLELPDTVDWRNEGYVTPVKNQGQCGSCWAFSATGALEGQNYRATGNLVSLSEQNLIDCSTAYENYECGGGYPQNAYMYIENNGGIDTEESYPYVAEDKTCSFSPSEVGATCTGFAQVTSGDELALKQAVASVGPISVCIDSSQQSFQLYSGGVYDDQSCNPNVLDHAVLVVGYGVYQGKDYWLVKNSWGTSWGMNGYIMMSRNQNNQCGIANIAVFPTVDGIVGDMNSGPCSFTCSFTSSSSRFVAFLFLIYYFIA